MLKAGENISNELQNKSRKWKTIPMLSRTHGQPATPTTMGKEFAVFWWRLSKIKKALEDIKIYGKMNGATGNFAAHTAAFPQKDWIKLSQEFVEQRLGLTWNPLTTQIEPHDYQAALLNEIPRLSNVLIDLCRDV